MGRDKALLTLPGTAELTFVEHLATLLAPLCAELVLVARDERAGREYAGIQKQAHCRLIYDEVPDQGPLMGLFSGLQAISSSHSHALVLAVDLPCVRPELLAWLASFPRGNEALVPLIEGIPQMLLARYPRSFLPLIAACLRGGRHDPRALLDRAPVHLLTEEQVRAHDPDLRSFLNVNTPRDFQHALTLFP